jgi:hypothetical protein
MNASRDRNAAISARFFALGSESALKPGSIATVAVVTEVEPSVGEPREKPAPSEVGRRGGHPDVAIVRQHPARAQSARRRRRFDRT